VRAAVAANRATPPQAGLLLAEDADAAVREALARRIGTLAPSLGPAAQDRLARIGGAVLARLAEDVAVEVRAALSEAVASLPDAPRELILKLARDTALPVAAPVLKLSPLLSEADLIGLVAAPPAGFTRRVVAARAGIGEAVSEALVDSAEQAAIAALLANGSAAIREATLDRLIVGAEGRPGWQAALARRPALPAQAVRALAAMLTGHLLEVLATRPDLPEGLAASLGPRIAARFEEAAPSQQAAREAALAGDRTTLLELLAAACGQGRERIEAALALRSPRVIVALCWQAGWTAELAEAVQLCCGVPRAKLVKANVEGGWTLSPAELQWQVELLADLPE
jgi:uncharacterized protein (DUF2336 family)